jgi:hypothetical protein
MLPVGGIITLLSKSKTWVMDTPEIIGPLNQVFKALETFDVLDMLISQLVVVVRANTEGNTDCRNKTGGS